MEPGTLISRFLNRRLVLARQATHPNRKGGQSSGGRQPNGRCLDSLSAYHGLGTNWTGLDIQELDEPRACLTVAWIWFYYMPSF